MICPRGLEYVKTDLITYRSFVRHRKLKGVLCTKLLPSCPNLCNPRDCSTSGKNTGVGCHVFLQGIFLTQGLNLGLPHCRQTPYRLSHHGREPFQTLMCLLHWQVGSLPRAPPQQAKSVKWSRTILNLSFSQVIWVCGNNPALKNATTIFSN